MIVLKVIWKLVRVSVLLPIYAILKFIEWIKRSAIAMRTN